MARSRTPRTELTRRSLLKAAGVGALGGVGTALAPFLPAALGQTGTAPKRVVLVTLSNGVHLDKWRPRGTEMDWTLSETLEPLAAYKDRLTVLDGVDLEVACSRSYRGYGHEGMGMLWTGGGLPPGPFEHSNSNWSELPSLDRLLSSRLDGREPLYLGCHLAGREYNGSQNCAHYRGGVGGRIRPHLDPRVAFDGLFAGVTSSAGSGAPDPVVLRGIEERRRIRDVLSSELRRIEAATVGLDRQIFQEHISQLARLEDDLLALEDRAGGTNGGACTIPSRPENFTPIVEDWARVPEIMTSQLDVGVRALQCDLTRVLCVQWGASAGSGAAPYLADYGYGRVAGIHGLTHLMLHEERARQQMADLSRWRMEFLRDHLLDPLESITDVDGSTLLDNTLVVFASEMSSAGNHTNRNIPITILQGRNLNYFHKDRLKKWGGFDPDDYTCDGCARGEHGGVPHNGVLVGICHALGLTDVANYGELETGVLEGIS